MAHVIRVAANRKIMSRKQHTISINSGMDVEANFKYTHADDEEAAMASLNSDGNWHGAAMQ